MILDVVIFGYVVMESNVKEGKWEIQQSSASLMDDMPCGESSSLRLYSKVRKRRTILLMKLKGFS